MTEMVWEAGKLLVWGIAVPIFNVDQNWNKFDPKKQFIFPKQFAIVLLSGILNTWICKVRDVLH